MTKIYCNNLSQKSFAEPLTASPTLALGFGTGKNSVFDMVKAGFLCNIIGVIVINIILNTWGTYYFDIKFE